MKINAEKIIVVSAFAGLIALIVASRAKSSAPQSQQVQQPLHVGPGNAGNTYTADAAGNLVLNS